jgi:hypothetical protein
MPYISTQKVKEIRSELKRTFPQFKFSVRRDNHSSVNVAVLSGPIDFGTTDESVNHYWLESHYGDRPKVLRFLTTLKGIMSAGQGSGYEDGDYGHIPDWYLDINIGRWDKPYTIKR